MSVLEWKNFNLYKLQPVADYQKLKEIKDKITSQCNNDDNIIFCDAHGSVHVYFSNWDCMSFQADRHPIKLCGITSSTSNILVTLTQDDLTNNVCVQIFSIVAKNKCAAFLGSGRLTAVMSAATALQASKIGNQLCIAIGFLRGDVYIFRGNINRDISSSFKTMFVCTRSITGFAFNHTDNLTLCMFVCSNSGIYCFTINESNIINETKSVLDSCIEGTHSFDMRLNCDDDAYFTVARDKAIYCFTNDGRGPCYVLDGEKPFVKWIGHNLLVVIDQKVSTFPITTTKIIMIDIKNKLIVLNKEFERMQNIIIQKSNCYLITKSMHVFLLRERIIENKIRMLTKKNLFDVAISQIESTGCNQKSLAEVSLQYGDYLSQKGEMTKATEMYIKTIGSIEPYHIIKKLLDSRNTKCLLRYLQVLLQEHREQLSRHHFELLKSCKERINLPTMLETQYFNDVCNQNAETPNINDSSINKVDESWRNKEQHNELLESFSEDEISQVIVGNIDRFKPPLNAASVVSLLHNLQKSRQSPIKASSLLAVLLTRSNNYIDLLEQMLTNVFVDFSEQILTNLFDRFLKSWKLSKEPSEQRILEFLKIYESRLNTENVIILCKLHSYWKGLLYFIERMGHSTLSTIYLTKNTNIHSVLENVTKWESVNANIWLPVLQKSKLSIEESTNLLYTMISKKTSSLLQMLQSFSCNKSIRVQHIKDCLQQELLQNVFGINELSNHIETLRYDFLDCKLALKNYGIKPIEFRNSTCDKCRQELSFPSVFFLCQHAFHKDCIRFYTERVICVICCSSTQTLNLADDRYCQSPSSILYFKGSCFNDSISEISKYLANGTLDQVLPDNEKMASQILIQKAKPHHILNSNDVKSNAADVKNKIGHTDSKVAKEEFISSTFISIPHINSNPFEAEETNPFEKYDDNLNPFRE